MSNSTEYGRARERAKAKFGFYLHAVVFIAVMLLLFGINLATSPEVLWVFWPLIGWGFAVALHGAVVFILGDRNTAIDALTERELRSTSADPKAEGSP